MSERRIRLFVGNDQPCSYLPRQRSRSQFIDPDAALDGSTYEALLQQGFRRSGRFLYRPACNACQACLPTRVPIGRFRPNRAQRRCTKRNADLETATADALTAEHTALYARYQRARHPGGPMESDDVADLRAFMQCEWLTTEIREFRHQGRLLAVTVTDRLPGALSAVYTFFDPILPARSLGRYGILEQIRSARESGLAYLYLGYTVASCAKMAYKAEYRPSEVFDGRRWSIAPPTGLN